MFYINSVFKIDLTANKLTNPPDSKTSGSFMHLPDHYVNTHLSPISFFLVIKPCFHVILKGNLQQQDT